MKFVRRRFRQIVRYSAVSLISTLTSIVILGVLVATNSMPAGWANVVATAIGTIPSFELNRRWVWSRTGSRHLGAEVVPFAVLSFAGLGLSTLAVHFADLYVRHAGWSNGTRTLAVEVASNAAYGALWVLQFVILDRVLFRQQVRAETPIPRTIAAVVDAPFVDPFEAPVVSVVLTAAPQQVGDDDTLVAA